MLIFLSICTRTNFSCPAKRIGLKAVCNRKTCLNIFGEENFSIPLLCSLQSDNFKCWEWQTSLNYKLVEPNFHSILCWNFGWQGIDGSRVEKVLEAVHIAANKNTVPGDVSAMVPGGIRMGMPPSSNHFSFFDFCPTTCIYSILFSGAPGTPALTSRGFIEEDFAKVAEFFDAAVKLALKIKANTKGSFSIIISLGIRK